jgi:hypothetical protein
VRVAGKLVATDVRLANGVSVRALLGNLDPLHPQLTRQFLSVSFHREGRWFHLARYFDADYRRRGPDALARFLGYHPDEIFPIAYDVRDRVRGEAQALAGLIPRDPPEKLTEAQLIALLDAHPPR